MSYLGAQMNTLKPGNNMSWNTMVFQVCLWKGRSWWIRRSARRCTESNKWRRWWPGIKRNIQTSWTLSGTAGRRKKSVNIQVPFLFFSPVFLLVLNIKKFKRTKIKYHFDINVCSKPVIAFLHRQGAAEIAQDIEKKLSEAEQQCRESLKSSWEECRPCLEDTCKNFYTNSCRRGFATFTNKVQYSHPPLSFKCWVGL